jgi:hypothetical protein
MTTLRLMVYRHSAFYSPILSAIAGGFLAHEGFEATYTVMPPGRSVGEMTVSGEIHVSQTAVSARLTNSLASDKFAAKLCLPSYDRELLRSGSPRLLVC